MQALSFIILPIIVIINLFILKKNRKLSIAILAIVLTYEINLFTMGTARVYFFDAIYISFLINKLLIISNVKSKTILRNVYKLKIHIYTYFFWLLFSTIFAFFIISDYKSSISNFISLIRYIQIISVFLLIVDLKLFDKEKMFVFKAMYLNGLVIAIYGIIQTYTNQGVNYGRINWWGRTYSVFEATGPNSYAIFSLFFMIVALVFFLDKRLSLKIRITNLLAFLLFLLPFIFSISRTGYVAFILIIPFLISQKNKKYLLSIPIIISFLILSDSVIYQRLIEFTFTENGLDSSSLGRLEYWKGALATIVRYPISGVGFNGFSNIGFRYMDYFDVLINVHNEYLQLLLNAGIIGFILFVRIIMMLWKDSTSKIKLTHNLFHQNIVFSYKLSILALAISSIFSAPFLNYQVTGQFWIASALIVGLDVSNDVKKYN